MIEVVVRNRPVGKGAVFYYEPALARYTGEILSNPKHIPNDCLVMSGDGFIPFRVIPRKDVVSIGGQAQAPVRALPVTQTWLVAGSKGNQYTVTQDAGRWSCTCPGFGFRRDCKHVQEKKNV